MVTSLSAYTPGGAHAADPIPWVFLGSAYVSQPFVAAVDAWRLQSAPCSCFWRVLAALGGCRQALSIPTRLQRAALIRQFIYYAPGGLLEASRERKRKR